MEDTHGGRVTYIMISLYFLINLLLAVVYDAFTAEEVKKFKKLFLHKRLACQHAFRLLVTREDTNHISFVHFSGLISCFATTHSTPINNFLMFKMINKSGTGRISLEEFYNIYDVVEFKWKPKHQKVVPKTIFYGGINKLVHSLAFTFTIYVIILLNGILLVVQTIYVDRADAMTNQSNLLEVIFIVIYTIEMLLKMVGLGMLDYLRRPWNTFDCMATLTGVVCLALTQFHIKSYYIMILRSLRLLRLFKVKKRFRDIFGTFVILLPRLNSALITLFLVYYVFGVIGLEIFGSYDLENCCENTSVETLYPVSVNDSGQVYYHLNNFHNLPQARSRK